MSSNELPFPVILKDQNAPRQSIEEARRQPGYRISAETYPDPAEIFWRDLQEDDQLRDRFMNDTIKFLEKDRREAHRDFTYY